MEIRTHWEGVYADKAATEVSWFQEHSAVSQGLILKTGVSRSAQIIDVGGGASTLVDDLLAEGFRNVTVLDISAGALQVAQERLGARATGVTWRQADITRVDLPYQYFDVWHDRAVFHFLTRAPDRRKYVEAVRRSVKPGGHVIVATFAPDGPLHCSGLEVMRFSPDTLHSEFGSAFQLVEHTREVHQTPFGSEQQFIYCYCRKV